MTAQLDTTGGLGGLTRRRRDGKVSGLCAAIAQRQGIDVWLVRGLFALLALSGGIGVPLYLWGWLLTPSDDDSAPISRLAPGFVRWPLPARGGVIIVTSLIVCSVIGWAAPFTIWPAVVIGALWWLARRGDRSRARKRAEVPDATRQRYANPTTPFDQSVATWLARLDEVNRLGTAPGTTAVATYRDPLEALGALDAPVSDAMVAPERVARPTAKRTRLFDLAVLAAAGAAGWAAFHFAPPSWQAPLVALAAALLVLGIGLVVRTFALRRRRPGVLVTLAGMACAAALVVQAGLAPAPTNHVELTYGAGTTLPSNVEAVGISQTIDLTDAPLQDAHTVKLDAVASNVVILLPREGANLNVQYVASKITLPSGERAGVGEVIESDADSRLTVTIEALVSNVEVRHG